MPSDRRRLEILAIWVGIAAGVVAILTYFGVRVSGNSGPAAANSTGAASTSSPAGPTFTPSSHAHSPESQAPSQPATRTITGNWSQQNGPLTLAISEVDRQSASLRLHMKATNNSAAEIDLPLFGYFVATDDTGQTYQSTDSSNWAITVPAGGFITGTVTLNRALPPNATRLNVSFTTVFGQDAPNGGITIHDVPIPK